MEKLWRRTDSCRSATTGLNIYIYRKYSKLQFRLFEEGGVYVMGTGLEAKTQQGATNKWSAAAEPQTSPNSSLLSFLLSPLSSLSLSHCLSCSLARSLIVPRLTGHSRPVMEMSCGGGGELHGVGN